VPRIKVAGLVVLPLAGVWVAGSVIGDDGNPVICPNDEPLSMNVEANREQPSMAEARAAQRDLPAGQRAVFNEYTGEFEGVDARTKAGTYGEVTVPERLVYKCDNHDEPKLVPLSEVDPRAAQEEHRQMSRLIRGSLELTGLGKPAGDARVPSDP
jgi:hypothetical protein